MSLLNLDNLEELVESLVKESINETYGPILVGTGEEHRRQNIVSQEIDQLHLRSTKKNKNIDDKDIDEQEDEEVEVSVTTSSDKEEKEDNKPKIKFTEELPDTIEVDQIIEKLNLIRSGPSLKDGGVLERFTEYFGALSGAEKIALQGFLDGLSQVIVGGVPGTEAQEPGKPPFNVKMDAKPQQDAESQAQKPTVKSKTTSSRVPSGTQAPIIVGEIANKTFILNKLKVLR